MASDIESIPEVDFANATVSAGPLPWAPSAVGRNDMLGRQSKDCANTISAKSADEETEGLRAELSFDKKRSGW